MGKINENLLKEFMTNFFGYGNLKGEYWFVGMEEGGCASEERINSKIEKWGAYDKPTLLDKGSWENKYQRTWGGLIKILLNFENENEPTLEEVKKFQTEKLGRSNSNNCIVEVFPLPSPNLKEFSYSNWTNISYLQSREEYKRQLQKPRTEKLRELILENKPKFVIFYSSSPTYLEYWYKISGAQSEDFEILTHKNLNAKFHKSDDIIYVIIHHPTYKGISNSYLKAVGKKMKEFSSCHVS